MASTTVFGEPLHARVLLITTPAMAPVIGDDEPDVAMLVIHGRDIVARLRAEITGFTNDGDVRVVVVPEPLQDVVVNS